MKTTKKEILTTSPSQTKKEGEILGKKVSLQEEAVFISLKGSLGSGKTTFLKGFAKGMGIEEKEVTSPTFLIYKKHKTKSGKNFYHFDAYRVKGKDLIALGFKKIKGEKESIVAVEWSENVEEILPGKRTEIAFFVLSPKERKLIIRDNSGIIPREFGSS